MALGIPRGRVVYFSPVANGQKVTGAHRIRKGARMCVRLGSKRDVVLRAFAHSLRKRPR